MDAEGGGGGGRRASNETIIISSIEFLFRYLFQLRLLFANLMKKCFILHRCGYTFRHMRKVTTFVGTEKLSKLLKFLSSNPRHWSNVQRGKIKYGIEKALTFVDVFL